MPHSLPDIARPFNLHVSDTELQELHQLLRLARFGPPTWENQHQDHRYGVPHDWLLLTRGYWLNGFNWRAQEARINSYSNYKLSISDEQDDVEIHFIALCSDKADAIPLVLLHGWPGSFLEFLPVLDLLKQKYTSSCLPFHVIVPSLPGYVLSSGPPKDSAWKTEDAARIIDKLIRKLGFDQYVVQGGDVGCWVASLLGANFDSVIGTHLELNLHPSLDPVQLDDPDLSENEKHAIQRTQTRFLTPTSGAAIMNSTRPATISAVVSSNPLALLAWIGEKFLEWPEIPISLDDILTDVSLYWFTDSFPRSLYTYRGTFTPGSPPHVPYIDKVFGYSWFMFELAPTPRKIAEKKGNLAFYRQHEHGGHFAALERPKEFLQDMEDFMQVVSEKHNAEK